MTKFIAAAVIALGLTLAPAAVEAKGSHGHKHPKSSLSSGKGAKKSFHKGHKHHKHTGLHKGKKKHTDLSGGKSSATK